jgi:hypothetical protein
MANCRLVVLPEDCYEQLKVLAANRELNESAPEQKAEASQDEPDETRSDPGDKTESADEMRNYVQQVLPPAYIDQGVRLYQQLLSAGLDISKQGQITLHNLPTYSMGELLRALCIKGHPGSVPLVLKEWLRKNARLHLTNTNKLETPAWEKRYSWRESTKAARHSSALKPSVKKRRP